MTLLLFHGGVFPETPLFWVPIYAFLVFSMFLVVRGVFRFFKSGSRSILLLEGAVVFVILMLPYFLGDHTVLPTLPFGAGAGALPFLTLTQFLDPGPHSLDNDPLLLSLLTYIGCFLNVIAIFSLVDLIAGLFRRVFGKDARRTVNLP
jgi:uncharacterized membrane protein (UPF0136 family)